MKHSGVLHPELLDVIASAGHGDIVVLTDAGLRVPEGKRRIDLALCCGSPSIVETVRAVASELVIEAAVVASEFEEWNPDVYQSTLDGATGDAFHNEPRGVDGRHDGPGNGLHQDGRM